MLSHAIDLLYMLIVFQMKEMNVLLTCETCHYGSDGCESSSNL